MDSTTDNLPATIGQRIISCLIAEPIDQQLATVDAITAFLPPQGYHVPPNQGSATFSRERYATILAGFATGEPANVVCKRLGVNPAAFWVWTSLPDLADLYKAAKQAHARSLMSLVSETIADLKGFGCNKNIALLQKRDSTENGTTGLNKQEMRAAAQLDHATVTAMERAARMAIEAAKAQNPDEYGDRLNVNSKSFQAVYVVSFAAGDVPGAAAHELQQAHEQGQIVEIPAPDSVGVERSRLTQAWRKSIARERKGKVGGRKRK